MRVSVIMPTYNGLSLLQRYLPALLAAEGMASAEVIVADDGSVDGTEEWLRNNAPQICVIRSAENQGFSRTCNAAMRAATGDALLLMNNDVAVTPGFLPPLERALESAPDVFAVNASILIPAQAMRDEGEKVGGFHHGIFYVDCVRQPALKIAPTLYATACAALYRRDKMEALGGFDELLSPFYWEDVDLSYRALRRGWSILYEPQSVVHHQHETTTSRLDPHYKDVIRARNQFLFVWKNMTDPRLTVSSLVIGGLVALEHAARRNEHGLWEGYRAALRCWPQVRARRAAERRAAVISDRALLARYSQVGRQAA